MRHSRVVALFALAVSAAGCFDFMGPGGTLDFGGGGGGYTCVPYYDYNPCTALDVSPTIANILPGDTMRFYTRSDSNHLYVTWAVSGSAASLFGTGYVAPGGGSMSAVVKGVARGKATLKASSVNSSHTREIVINVADSADMTDLRILTSINQVKVKQILYINSSLMDASGAVYRGSPTWTSTDPNVFKVAPGNVSSYVNITANAVGTAKLIASFRDLRDTLVISVIP